MSNEEELKIAIDTYKQQIEQIDGILDSSSNSDLQALKNDLIELMHLTEESLIEYKKKKLLDELDKYAYDNENNNESCVSTQSIDNTKDELVKEEDDDLIGHKCRVPFECKTSGLVLHNAIITEIVSYHECKTNFKLKVIFCNPTLNKMKMCKYLLDDTCKFNEICKYSHGFEVTYDKLQDFYEPHERDYRVGNICLALDADDDLWHLATIESIDESELVVQFKRVNKTIVVSYDAVLPLDSCDQEVNHNLDTIENYFQPRKLIDVCEKKNDVELLGTWEKHTKGIGSKLLAKMGYKPGKGLGVNGEGILKPIDVYVLPAGKSLDKIMELKEKNLLKKEKFMPKVYKRAPVQDNLFDFLNNKLLKKTHINLQDNRNQHSNTQDLNLRIFKNQENIKNAEKSIEKLKESIARNKNCDKNILDSMRTKLKNQEGQLDTLKLNSSQMQKEKDNRKEKNDIF